MDELEEIRQKKLAELQAQQQQQIQQQAQMQQQIEQLEQIVRQFLTKEALQRYGNLKAAHPEKAVQILVLLGQAAQQGQIKEKITDAEFKNLLQRLAPQKKEFKIKRI